MKRLTGRKVHKIEGDRSRLFTEIECEDCGRITLERRTGRIQKALQAGCIHCHRDTPPPSFQDFLQDGRSAHPLYGIWSGMLYRCYNANCSVYPYYGGRDIRVCFEWFADFWRFVDDIGERPSPNHSIDRIDVNGNYEPSNCRWSTQSEQMLNRRPKQVK